MSRQAFGWSLVAEARKYIGTNPTDRSRLWCATFMNFVLAKVGYAGTNSDAAKSFADYGRRISEPQVGAIAVLTRGRRGGHVGVVSGIDANGNPVIISGNHNKTVGEGVYPRSRVIAYVMPTGARPVTTEMAARSNFSRVPSEQGFESPIAELLAAIEAEQARPGRNRQAAQQLLPHRPVQPAAISACRCAPARRVSIRKLAEFLGIEPRAGGARWRRRGQPRYPSADRVADRRRRRRRSPRHRRRSRRGRSVCISVRGMVRSRMPVCGSTLVAAQRTMRLTTLSRAPPMHESRGRAGRIRARPASRAT